MWTATCLYCEKEIADGEACYPVYTDEKHYRHLNCYPKKVEQPLDYAKPFGEVTDEDIWKGG